MVRRIDTAPLKASRNDAGFLIGEANVTRTGVFTYRLANGTTRRELRSPAEVFKADSLKTLSMAPITLDHPKDGASVTSSNAKALAVGAVGDAVRADGRFVRAPFAIHDEGAIAEVESGRMRELSCGYNCDLDDTPGEFNGEHYDGVQRNITYNHLAVVARGRAGSEVSIRLDAADAVCVDSNRPDGADSQEKTMKKIVIDGIEYEVSEQVAQAFARADGKTAAELAQLKKDVEKQTARADALESEAKKLREDSTDEKIAKRVNERVALVTQATKVLGAEFKCDGNSDDELKRAVIAKITPDAKLEGKSADYVSARFDTALELHEKDTAKEGEAADGVADARKVITNADGAEDKLTAARKKMIERNRAMNKLPAA